MYEKQNTGTPGDSKDTESSEQATGPRLPEDNQNDVSTLVLYLYWFVKDTQGVGGFELVGMFLRVSDSMRFTLVRDVAEDCPTQACPKL